MIVRDTNLPGVLVIEPRIFRDDRGFFLETFQSARYHDAKIPREFRQDNFSRSKKGTLRGLHYQEPNAQGKLVQVTRGRVWDVAVDIRRGSPTFAQSFGLELDGDSLTQLWIPPGFAHGFCVLSDEADFHYKCTELYVHAHDRGIRWNDPDLKIAWPIENPLLSAKDAGAPLLKDALLPNY
jgi:dTDP-4-dehydrorhamnose 3,5-epimerase